jgi:hypothetical protein
LAWVMEAGCWISVSVEPKLTDEEHSKTLFMSLRPASSPPLLQSKAGLHSCHSALLHCDAVDG